MKGLGCFHEQSVAEDPKAQRELQQHGEEMQQAEKNEETQLVHLAIVNSRFDVWILGEGLEFEWMKLVSW